MENQALFRIKENGQGLFLNVIVEGEACVDRSLLRGWLRLREFIGPLKGLKVAGVIKQSPIIQIVSDRDAYPLSPYRPPREVMAAQCKVSGDEEMADRQRNYQIGKENAERRKNFLTSALGFALIGIVVLTLVVVLLYVKGGFKVNIS